jgi:hypothetical protein
MDNFLDLYDEYLEKILYAVNNYSGKHSITPTGKKNETKRSYNLYIL